MRVFFMLTFSVYAVQAQQSPIGGSTTGPVVVQTVPAPICSPGYATNPASGRCSNINECIDGQAAPCSVNATCSDSDGSYHCTCNTGYVGSGFGPSGCLDIDECSTSAHSCATRSACTNTPGSYYCCSDNPVGLVEAYAAAAHQPPAALVSGAPDCGRLLAATSLTEMCSTGSDAQTIRWFCARTCSFCADRHAEQASGGSAPLLTRSPTLETTTRPPTAGAAQTVDTTPATLSLRLLNLPTTTDAGLARSVCDRLAAIVGNNPGRFFTSTFVVQSGALNVIIAGATRAGQQSSQNIRDALQTLLLTAPQTLQYHSQEVTITLASDESAVTPESGSSNRNGGDSDGNSTSVVGILIAMVLLTLLGLAIVVATSWKRHRGPKVDEVQATITSLGLTLDDVDQASYRYGSHGNAYTPNNNYYQPQDHTNVHNQMTSAAFNPGHSPTSYAGHAAPLRGGTPIQFNADRSGDYKA